MWYINFLFLSYRTSLEAELVYEIVGEKIVIVKEFDGWNLHQHVCKHFMLNIKWMSC